MGEKLAAGSNDGLDELAVCVFIRTRHQLLEALTPIGPLIIRARNVERANRVVRRGYDIDGVEPQTRHFESIAQCGRFSRRQKSAHSPSQLEMRGRQPMRRRRSSHSADDDCLRDADGSQFVEQSCDQARPVTEAMSLAAPVSICRKGHLIWIAQDRGGQPGGSDVERLVPRGSQKVERVGSPLVLRPCSHEFAAIRLLQQRGHYVSPRIEIGGDNHQFAKTRLTEILGKDLSTPSAERGGGRYSRSGGIPDQLPDDARKRVADRLCIEWSTDQAPPPASFGLSLHALLGTKTDCGRNGCGRGDRQDRRRESNRTNRLAKENQQGRRR